MSRRARGFSIISAIFLLVVLAGLGGFMISMSTTQSITSAQDLQGSRAYHAAQAGLEWGLYQVLDPTNATVVAPGSATWPHMPDCPGATTLTIEDFTVVVSCTRYPDPGVAAGATGPPVYTEAGTSRSAIVYVLTARASSGAAVGSLTFVEREISASVTKCRWSDNPNPPYECP